MKRFYTLALSERDEDSGGYRILLDGRPVRTPMRAALAVPGAALAEAIVSEWSGQGEAIDPATMPITGLANATIDQVLSDVGGFADMIAQYAASDLLCYRASEPAELVAQQAAQWDPLLDWAGRRHGLTFTTTSGIMPVDQSPAVIGHLAEIVHGLDPWLLAGLSTVVTTSGSLIGSLALMEEAISPDTLWSAAHVDEDWQIRRWGEDHEAAARTAIRRAHYDDAARYCALVSARPDTHA